MFGPRMKNKSNASADDGRFTSNTCTSANEFLQGRRNTPPHKRQEEVVIRQRRGLGGQMEAFPAVPQAQAPSERGVHNGSLYTQAPPASPVAVLLCMVTLTKCPPGHPRLVIARQPTGGDKKEEGGIYIISVRTCNSELTVPRCFLIKNPTR